MKTTTAWVCLPPSIMTNAAQVTFLSGKDATAAQAVNCLGANEAKCKWNEYALPVSPTQLWQIINIFHTLSKRYNPISTESNIIVHTLPNQKYVFTSYSTWYKHALPIKISIAMTGCHTGLKYPSWRARYYSLEHKQIHYPKENRTV